MSLGRSLDASVNSGEEIRFKQRHKNLMIELSKSTHFTYEEVELLGIIYYKLQKISGKKNNPVRLSIIKDVLHNAFDLTDYDITPFIIYYFHRSAQPTMKLASWINMMSLFLRGSMEEKIPYCFQVYQSVGMTEKIMRRTILKLLKHSLIKDNCEDDDEAVKDMVDMLMKRMDFDRDGKLSYDDYRQTVEEQPGLLECFGETLPSRLAVYSFKNTVLENKGKK